MKQLYLKVLAYLGAYFGLKKKIYITEYFEYILKVKGNLSEIYNF